MITDDTILEKLCWQQFERSGKSYDIAEQKYKNILSYVFPSLDTTDGIEIECWQPEDSYCFKGIQLNFWNNFEKRKCFRYIEFKGMAKDFKAKVLEKFEALKTLKQEADAKCITRENELTAKTNEIVKLTKIAKQKFNRYAVTISQWGEGYRLQLETNFDNKKELLDFCNLEE